MVWVLLLVLVVALAVYAVPRLLARITDWGGERKDALDITDKFVAETNAFRGSGSPDDPTWDGKNRIAPPTQDGGI